MTEATKQTDPGLQREPVIPSSIAIPNSGQPPLEMERRRDELVEAVARVVITDETTLERATTFTAQIKAAHAKAEDMRKAWTNPLNAVVKSINAAFKTITDPLEKAERAVKVKIAAYVTEQEEKAHREAEEQAAQARAAAEASGEPAPPPAPILMPRTGPIRSSLGGTASVREVWDFEVIDTSLVPFKYLVVNEKAVREAVNKGERDIPGIRIFAKKQVAIS